MATVMPGQGEKTTDYQIRFGSNAGLFETDDGKIFSFLSPAGTLMPVVDIVTGSPVATLPADPIGGATRKIFSDGNGPVLFSRLTRGRLHVTDNEGRTLVDEPFDDRTVSSDSGFWRAPDGNLYAYAGEEKGLGEAAELLLVNVNTKEAMRVTLNKSGWYHEFILFQGKIMVVDAKIKQGGGPKTIRIIDAQTNTPTEIPVDQIPNLNHLVRTRVTADERIEGIFQTSDGDYQIIQFYGPMKDN
jgi:hypothetical protein